MDKNKILGVILLVFGLTIISIVPSQSSWSYFYSLCGMVIAFTGFSKLIKKLTYLKRIFLEILFLILSLTLLLLLDYINVVFNNQVAKFSYQTKTTDRTIWYHTPFYNVFRINTAIEFLCIM